MCYRIKFIPQKFEYELHSSKQGAFAGTLRAVTEKAIDMGLEECELEAAFREMAKNKHMVANFGFNGKFMYSK